jgi:tetratricopeptide (TPR) repeat protein
VLLELEKLSLIKWDRSKRLIWIHRLVQTVINDEMDEEERTSAFNRIVCLCLRAFPTFTNKTRSLCRLYQSQVLSPLIHTRTITTVESAEIRYRVGWYLHEDGNYYDSANLLEQAVNIGSQNAGPEALETLRSMHALAISYYDLGKNQEAFELQKVVLEKQRKVLREDHPSILATMHSLAISYYDLGRNQEAFELQKEVLEKQRKVLRQDHPDLLLTIGNLSIIYFNLGEVGKAAELMEDALNGQRRVLRGNHPHILTSMRNLAMIYRRQGRVAEAIKLEQEVSEKS